MTDYKFWLGALSVAVAIGSYIPYFWGIHRGYIKPHAFTWLVWGVLTGTGFVASLLSGGAAGSWIMLLNALACLTIGVIALYQGSVKYTKFDWAALCGGLLGIGFWAFTKNPTYAVVLVSISDILGLLPSIRKSYTLPNEESVLPWAIGISYYVISLFALGTYNLITLLYPITIIVADLFFVIFVTIRRKQI